MLLLLLLYSIIKKKA